MSAPGVFAALKEKSGAARKAFSSSSANLAVKPSSPPRRISTGTWREGGLAASQMEAASKTIPKPQPLRIARAIRGHAGEASRQAPSGLDAISINHTPLPHSSKVANDDFNESHGCGAFTGKGLYPFASARNHGAKQFNLGK